MHLIIFLFLFSTLQKSYLLQLNVEFKAPLTIFFIYVNFMTLILNLFGADFKAFFFPTMEHPPPPVRKQNYSRGGQTFVI